MSLQSVRKTSGNRLTALMQVRNEADRYLTQVLENLSTFCDNILIVDDASTDHTVELCHSFEKVSKVVMLDQVHFSHEWELRSFAWQTACETEPDWVIVVDADEIYEQKMQGEVYRLINQDKFDWVGFRIYDFWGGQTHYREDDYWNLHRRFTMTMVRYFSNYPYFFPKMDHHVPRLPVTYSALPGYQSRVRVKHFGWAGSEAERHQKYQRYLEMDPVGKWGSMAHYQSILDPNPNLIAWEEDEA